MKNIRANKAEGYANRHNQRPLPAATAGAEKNRHKNGGKGAGSGGPLIAEEGADAGGIVRKFRNIDQIPDDYQSATDRTSDNVYTAGIGDLRNNIGHQSIQYDAGHNSISASRNCNDPNEYQSFTARGKMPPAVESVSSARSPPLPYEKEISKYRSRDDDRVELRSTSRGHNVVPQAPVSSYFGYEPEPDPGPDYGYVATEAAATAVLTSAPPLPCDFIVEKKPMTSDEQIFYSRKPRQVEFKPCTVKQYKIENPKEYVTISNSKPDLNTDELKAKRANLERIKEFSKNLHSFNKKSISAQPKLPASMEKRDIELSKQKMESKRQKAIEFAKHIPKPKTMGGSDMESRRKGGSGEPNDKDDLLDEDMLLSRRNGFLQDAAHDAELLELEAKHNAGRMQIEAIRKTMGLK